MKVTDVIVTPIPVLSITISRDVWGEEGDDPFYQIAIGSLTSTILTPERRRLEADAYLTPDRMLYHIRVDDADPNTAIITFWGRPPREEWPDGPIPPWERFTYRVRVNGQGVNQSGVFINPELIDHQIRHDQGDA